MAQCGVCGYTAPVPGVAPVTPVAPPPAAAPAARHEYAPVPRPVHPRVAGPATPGKITTGLILNLILPGWGTHHAGRHGEGWLQVALFVVGVATLVYLVGLALVAAAYVWAITGSILHLVATRRAASPRPTRPS